MKQFLAFSFILLCACKKNDRKDIPDDPAFRNGMSLVFARVIGVDLSCSDQPYQVKIITDVAMSGFRKNLSDLYWTYNLPDTLKAIGQYIELEVSQPFMPWRKCGDNILPDEIVIDKGVAVHEYDYWEVIDVDVCAGLSLLKRYPRSHYDPEEQVWCANVPNDLKIAGRKFYAVSRIAGIYELRKCIYSKQLKQVVLSRASPN